MKKIITLIAIVAISFTVKSQNIDKPIVGIQTGFLGGWVYGELEVIDHLAIRGEVGCDIGAWGRYYHSKPSIISSPVFTLEPRWYLKETRDKGVFLALKTSYTMDWFDLGYTYENERIGAFLLIPSFGLRRSIGNHFDYELGFGYGFQRKYLKHIGYENEDNYVPNIRIRIGFHI